MSTEKHQVDIDKGKLEIEIAKKTLSTFHAQQRMEKTKIWLTFITSIVGLSGLFLTLNYQQRQLVLLQAQHDDSEFSKRIEILSNSKTDQSKFAGIVSLTSYLNSNQEDVVRDRTIQMLVLLAENDDSIAIQTYIMDQLIKRAPDKTLAFLLEQNREISEFLPDSKIVEDNIDTAYNRHIAHASDQLLWNAKAVVKTFKTLKNISNIDLSMITLNIPKFRFQSDTTYKGSKFYIHNTTTFRHYPVNLDSVHFTKVNFAGASLNSVDISNCTFDNCSFNDDIMIDTKFKNCSFRGACSFKNISWGSDNLVQRQELEEYFPTWTNCSIEAISFTPIDTVSRLTEIDHKFSFFYKSKWNLQSISNSNRFALTQKGNNGYNP